MVNGDFCRHGNHYGRDGPSGPVSVECVRTDAADFRESWEAQ
jgi:hypothetical protein